jgi:hypothetical protein
MRKTRNNLRVILMALVFMGLAALAHATWDIYIQDFPADAKSAKDIPKSFKPKPIGKRSIIIRKIKEVAPDAVFSDPAWGRIERNDFAIDISLGLEGQVVCIALYVSGSDAAAQCVADIVRHLNLRALDTGTGEFFDPNDPAKGLRAWRKHEEHVKEKKD